MYKKGLFRKFLLFQSASGVITMRGVRFSDSRYLQAVSYLLSGFASRHPEMIMRTNRDSRSHIIPYRPRIKVAFEIQGARGIGARFLKLSPASAVSPILTNFHSIAPTPPAFHLPARIKGPRQESQRGDIIKIIHAV